MRDVELIERYQLLYQALGAEGRRELLLGSCGEPALEAFRSCAVGSRMPTVYFELPLAGEPRFDLQVCLDRSAVMEGCELPATAPAVLGPLLDWVRMNDDCSGVDLAFDVASGELRTPQVMAMMRDRGLRGDVQHGAQGGDTQGGGTQREDAPSKDTPLEGAPSKGAPLEVTPSKGAPRGGQLRDVGGFFSAAGDFQATMRYQAVDQRAPKGWAAWYVGLAAQRPGRPVRLDYSVVPKLQGAYLAGRRSLGDDLHAMGYDASEGQLELCRALLEFPFTANLQLDVMDDGSVGPVLGYSLSMPHWGPARSRQELVQGALADAFSLVEGWGLADGRWRQIAGCCIGAAVELPGHREARMVAIRSVPTFLKVRMTPDRLLDAKTYIMCTLGDFISHPIGANEA